MELGSVIGFILGFLFLLLSILASASWSFSGILPFLSLSSALLVFGGVFASTLIGTPLNKFVGSMKAISKIFKASDTNHAEAIEKIIKLANLARKEGILALEESARDLDDAFLQKGLMLIVDGTDPELVRSILETELVYIEGRHDEVRKVWEDMAGLAPSWGMMGTLIGLILMLGDLSDPSTIGPSMAVALITTFYGAIIASYVCNPVASKMKIFNAEEKLMKEVLIEGMLSIQAGENPRIIEEKLKSFLSPDMRKSGGSSDSRVGED